MKLRSLNNATILLESRDNTLLIDPWIVGDLYHGAWTPVVKMDDLKFLKSVSHVFISHIHEDHWDRKTLELLNKDVIIFIPNLQINKVLKKYIEELGFHNIKFIDFFVKENLGDLQITIVPPMNAFGQELGSYYNSYETDATHIDTSLLVEDSLSNTSHLFLCDNTPYDLSVIREFFKNTKLTSLWYPFNSYAQDYPVCYDFTESELVKIHDEMHVKRKETIRKCIQFLKPQYYFPHSADFILNGPVSKKFNSYICKEFFDRNLVALNYDFPELKHSLSKYALFGDVINFDNSGEIKIKRDQFKYELLKSKSHLKQLPSKLNGNTTTHIKEAFKNMLKRCKNFNIDISNAKNWILTIKTEMYEFNFSYDYERLLEENELDKKYKKRLMVLLTQEKLEALLSRELHWNNAQIGYHINFKRIPNIYCQELYKSLNFLHL